jgi:peptide/nickel transport system permease protein
MAAHLLRRLLVSLGVLVLISIGIFVLIRSAPGDPVAMMIPPENMGPGSEAFVAAKRAELGLDQALPVQYVLWLGHALTGDLGYSIGTGQPVAEMLAERAGPTVYLMGLSLVLALLIAVPLGLFAAVRKNSGVDYTASVLTLGAVCLPPFFVGIMGIYVFSLKLGLLPSAGMSTPGRRSTGDALLHLIMPLAILGFAYAGVLTRYVRSSVIGELTLDYVRTAVAKGAGQARVLTRHVLRNAMIPVITVVAILIPQLLAGAVVIEAVFAWPGMGQLAVKAVTARDYPVVIGFAMVVAVLVLICNIVADVLYTVVDPRVRLR